MSTQIQKVFERFLAYKDKSKSKIYISGQNQGQSVSLEDLLHKPVARVQKNCMSLQDLIKHTPETSPDHANLSESLSLMQEFLNVYNLEHRFVFGNLP